jgi:uncharacterized membrane protein
MNVQNIAVGLKKDRVEALHDAIYAVAMTLLVLNLHVPEGVTSFGDFVRQLHAQLPQFLAGAIAFSVVGLIWLNNYYRNAMVMRVDLTHITLDIAAAGMIVLVPFSTRALEEYWVHPWGIAIFSWNVCAAILLYIAETVHDIRHLIPEQVDQKFLRLNLTLLWLYAFLTGVFVPALALLSPLAAVIMIPVVTLVNLYSRARLQPGFVQAHMVALAHEEDVRAGLPGRGTR